MNIHRLSAADYSEYPRERGEWPKLKYDVMRRAGTKERTTGRTRRFLVRFNVCVLFLHLSATICFSWKKSKVKNQFVHIPIFFVVVSPGPGGDVNPSNPSRNVYSFQRLFQGNRL